MVGKTFFFTSKLTCHHDPYDFTSHCALNNQVPTSTMAGQYPRNLASAMPMTEPKPRLQHRLFNDNNSNNNNEGSLIGSSSSFDSISGNGGGQTTDPAEIIRKNLFAPPLVAQNEIFRKKSSMVANNHHGNHMIHQRPSTAGSIHSSGNGSSTTFDNSSRQGGAPASPMRYLPPMLGSTCNNLNRRTGNDDFCGLSAEIYSEIAHRTAARQKQIETPLKTASTTKNIMSSMMKVPVSRDLFSAKTTGLSGTFAATVVLTPTKSLSSGSDSDGSSTSSTTSFTHGGIPRPVIAAATTGTTGKKKTKKRGSTLMTTPTTTKTPLPNKKKPKFVKTPFPTTTTATTTTASARKKLKKSLTPPRKTFGSHTKLYRASSNKSLAAAATLSSAFGGVDEYTLSSTENDPAPFQVELPSKKEVMVYAKICALMDGYTAIHREFNFAMLSGVSYTTLQKEYERSTPDKPMIAGSCHRDVVRELLDVGVSDIIVEGFFREYTIQEKDKDSERIEAIILSSERLRQIIVCFRGSTMNQAKPLHTGIRTSLFEKVGQCPLNETEKQNVYVLDTFRSTYFGTPLEKTLFALLTNLEMRKPFFDITIIGHSFGATMATIASYRLATSKPQMRVSCFVYGSPRVGGEEWRQAVHSVPNLRLYRVENGSDPFVQLPHGSEWSHCGHAIQISDLMNCNGKVGVTITARRFDISSSVSTTATNTILGFATSKVLGSASREAGKIDHEIQAYVEKLTRTGSHWFTDFCELLDNKGVMNDTNDERRELS